MDFYEVEGFYFFSATRAEDKACELFDIAASTQSISGDYVRKKYTDSSNGIIAYYIDDTNVKITIRKHSTEDLPNKDNMLCAIQSIYSIANKVLNSCSPISSPIQLNEEKKGHIVKSKATIAKPIAKKAKKIKKVKKVKKASSRIEAKTPPIKIANDSDSNEDYSEEDTSSTPKVTLEMKQFFSKCLNSNSKTITKGCMTMIEHNGKKYFMDTETNFIFSFDENKKTLTQIGRYDTLTKEYYISSH
jgi:hypothetical protein